MPATFSSQVPAHSFRAALPQAVERGLGQCPADVPAPELGQHLGVQPADPRRVERVYLSEPEPNRAALQFGNKTPVRIIVRHRALELKLVHADRCLVRELPGDPVVDVGERSQASAGGRISTQRTERTGGW